MDARFATYESVPTEATTSTAFNRNRLMRQALTPGRFAASDRGHTGLQTLRVLVVADEQDSANALFKLVWHGGHAAHVASDGFSAARVAAAQHPHVVLLDLAGSFTAECRVARHLRFDYPSKDCLVIAVTERAGKARRKQCIKAGIDLLLTKPVDPEVVETLLILECARVNRRQLAGAIKMPNRLTSTDCVDTA